MIELYLQNIFLFVLFILGLLILALVSRLCARPAKGPTITQDEHGNPYLIHGADHD